MQTPSGADRALRPADVARFTGRFRDLQGLRQVVAGVFLLFAFLWTLVFPVSSASQRAAGLAWTITGLAALILIAAGLIYGVRRTTAWYSDRYGAVEHTLGQRRQWVILASIGLLAFLIPFQLEVSAMNAGQSTPINLMVIGLTIWMAVYWVYLGLSFVHYAALAALGSVLAIASLAGLPPAEFAWHLREALLYMGAASVVGGIIDHRILAAALPHPLEAGGNEQ